MVDINKTLPSKAYNELIALLMHQHANLLFQLCANHVPLQTYLERIGKAPTSCCPTCHSAPKTGSHYLLICPTYLLHRAVHFHPLGHSRRTLFTLLNSKDAL